jgi:hypothetical protein
LTVFHDFNPATVSSPTYLRIYTHAEIEGIGGGVWRIRREVNTAPEDALLVYIGRREEGEVED